MLMASLQVFVLCHHTAQPQNVKHLPTTSLKDLVDPDPTVLCAQNDVGCLEIDRCQEQ